MRVSRTTLSCLLHVKGYAAYSAFAFTYIFRLRSRSFDRRLSHLASASHVVKVVTDSRAASLHRRYPASPVLPTPPPPSRLSADFPGLPVIRPTFAPPISQRGEEGFSSCLARPRHRTVATTPPECRSASASLRYAMLLSSKT